MSDRCKQTSKERNAEISAQAAHWLVMLEDDANDELKQAFAAWLAEDQRHREAVERIQKMLGDMQQVQQFSTPEMAHQIIDSALHHDLKTQHNYIFKGLLLLALCGFISVILALQYAPLPYWIANQHNTSQSWRADILPDHSQIRMAGKTAYDLNFNEKNRNIELLQGHILVDVAKDHRRPFIVKTAYGNIQALGTRFIVTQDQDETTVTMLESKTQLWSDREHQHKVAIIAGQRLSISAQGVVSDTPIYINANLIEQAWNQHVLVANGDSLVQVLDYLSMYYAGKISFDRQQLQGIRVTATLPLEHIDQSLQQLATELHLDIAQHMPYHLSIERKK